MDVSDQNSRNRHKHQINDTNTFRDEIQIFFSKIRHQQRYHRVNLAEYWILVDLRLNSLKIRKVRISENFCDHILSKTDPKNESSRIADFPKIENAS